MTEPKIQRGFADEHRRAAAELYDEAFGAKLAPAIRDDAARLDVLESGMVRDYCFAAVADGELLGIAGFHDAAGSLTSGISMTDVRNRLGWLRALRAGFVLAFLDRTPVPGELLMDGIVVRSDARGRGIGSALFAALEDHARERGHRSIRLDVIDTNPAARRLYERIGFVGTKTTKTPYLRRLMGFGAVTAMVKAID